MSKQQQVAPTTVPPESAPAMSSGGNFEQVGGNAFAAEQMGIQSSPVNGIMARVMACTSGRVDGADKVWDRVSASPASPDPMLGILAGAITAAVMGTTALYTAPIVASVAAVPALSVAARAVLGAFVNTAITSRTPDVLAFVQGALNDEQGRTPLHDMYFLASKGAIRMAGVLELESYENLCNFLIEEGAPPAAMQMLMTKLDMAIPKAEELQMQRSITEWLTYLATVDTGGDKKNGSDLGETGSGRSPGDKARGQIPRGVVHLHVVFGDPKNDPVVKSAKIDGLPADLVPSLVQGKVTLGELNLPLWIGGTLAPGEAIEVTCNEKGTMGLTQNGRSAEGWMNGYAMFHGVDTDQAPKVLADHMKSLEFGLLPIVLA